MNLLTLNLLTLDRGGICRDLPHFPYRGFRIRTVKDRRTCDDPVTPRANHFREILPVDPPSISIGSANFFSRRSLSNFRTFSRTYGINFWPPKPGFTLISST